MSLNTKKAPKANKGLDLPLIEEGPVAARLLSVVDIGLH